MAEAGMGFRILWAEISRRQPYTSDQGEARGPPVFDPSVDDPVCVARADEGDDGRRWTLEARSDAGDAMYCVPVYTH